MAKGMGARKGLEFGTLGGYSAIWLARALPAGGQLVTVEVEKGYDGFAVILVTA